MRRRRNWISLLGVISHTRRNDGGLAHAMLKPRGGARVSFRSNKHDSANAQTFSHKVFAPAMLKSFRRPCSIIGHQLWSGRMNSGHRVRFWLVTYCVCCEWHATKVQRPGWVLTGSTNPGQVGSTLAVTGVKILQSFGSGSISGVKFSASCLLYGSMSRLINGIA